MLYVALRQLITQEGNMHFILTAIVVGIAYYAAVTAFDDRRF